MYAGILTLQQLTLPKLRKTTMPRWTAMIRILGFTFFFPELGPWDHGTMGPWPEVTYALAVLYSVSFAVGLKQGTCGEALPKTTRDFRMRV